MSYFPAPIPQPVTATAGDFAVTAVGIVGVTQATSPWVTTSTISGISTVTGTVFATLAGTSVVAGIVSATQGTSPWIVAGTVSATQGTSPWVVSAAAIGATQSGVWAVNSTVTSIPGVGPTGTTAPTTAIVNGIIVSGTLQAVSSTFPMPVSAAITGAVIVVGDAASGSAVAGNPVLVGGSDGTDARTIATDTGGQVKVLVENTVPVTGTFYQATQPVSGTVVAEIEGHAGATLDGAAGSPSTQCLTIQGNSSGTAVPVTGTFYPTTQPVEITGHAGATLDGTAGSPSTGVLTIQGVGSGTAVPVSGTFYQATQPVSGTVTAEIEGHGGATLDAAPGAAIPTNAIMVGGSDGTDLRAIATDTGGQVKVLVENTVPVTGTFYQATQPVSAASLPLPSGASTSNTQGPVTPGVAATDSDLIGTQFNSTAPNPTTGQQLAMQSDARGNVHVNIEGRKATYSVSGGGTIIVGGNLILAGSASKTIRITQVIFSGYATTPAAVEVLLCSLSAFSGGTAGSGILSGPFDTANPANSATPTQYTATPVVTIETQLATFLYEFATVAQNVPVIVQFGNRAGAQCPTIRGTGQAFALYIASAPTGGYYQTTIEWTEE